MSKRAEELATRIITGYWVLQNMSRPEAVALIDAELRKAVERAAKRAEDHLIDEKYAEVCAERDALRARIASVKDWCDLMVDEFTRISHLTDNEEIKGLCERAITNTKQHFPIMKQRDDFYARWTAEKARADALEARLASAQSSAQGEEAREMREALEDVERQFHAQELADKLVDRPCPRYTAASIYLDITKTRAVLERKETK